MPFVRRFVLALYFSTAFASAQQTPPPPAPTAPSAPGATPSSTAPDLPDSPGTQVPTQLEPTGPTAVFDTSMGRIKCKLFDKQAPQTVANFIGLAEGTKDWTDPATREKEHGKPLYDGTIFHRVIPGFMAQGGDPLGTGMGDPGYFMQDEIDPSLMFDVPGRLAMANSGPNTDGSQFFITEESQPDLNGHYTVFGQCDPSSVLVVKTITRVERDARDKPLTPVILKKVTIVPVGQPLPAPPSSAASSAPASAPATNATPAAPAAPPVLAPRPN
ncbi:MAG TPA: peptidylprolyl isomerase [Acidobacteriaceae bacterium]|jgi:peptidyl-prolyl cis-trans isomerase A (cyclophilin A)